MMNSGFKFLLCLSVWLSVTLAATTAHADTIAADQSAAVIFAYHRIGEDTYPETNIRKEQLEAQIKELGAGNYNVISLAEALDAIKNGTKLPENSIVLTFDGGHKSIMAYAVPLIEAFKLPYTVFIATDHIDRGTESYMDWGDIKTIAKSKYGTIGLHPASYVRLYQKPEEEIARQINKARTRLREETGQEARYFAYPFGEYGNAYKAAIAKLGFEAAFSQQSGVVTNGQDMFSLPRFPMTEQYGGLDRFKLAATALPLPVTDVEPKDPLLPDANASIGFTVDKELAGNLDRLSCFVSGQEKPDIEIVGETRVELRLKSPLESERTRVNCTMPVLTDKDNYEEPRWRWFGMQLMAPNIQQSWHNNEDETVIEEIDEEDDG